MKRPAVAIAALMACSLAACHGEPETVLQSDLPQVPGMTPRESSGLRQEGSRVVGGQFEFKGPVPSLGKQVAETMSRFDLAGWTLASETTTGATAVLVYRKDTRTARVEIVRNGVQPRMSTAVLLVESSSPAPTAAPAPAPTPVPAAAAPSEPAAQPAEAPKPPPRKMPKFNG